MRGGVAVLTSLCGMCRACDGDVQNGRVRCERLGGSRTVSRGMRLRACKSELQTAAEVVLTDAPRDTVLDPPSRSQQTRPFWTSPSQVLQIPHGARVVP